MKHLLFIVVFFISNLAFAQRIELPFNSDWQFSKGNFSFDNTTAPKWQAISLPHTWNATDVMDDEPGYYRGPCSYKKTFSLPNNSIGKEVFLNFEGVNQLATVFINGKKAGTHIGGYTGFVVRITPFVYSDRANEVEVLVDNSHNKNIPPLSADFTFYGGIYRDVQLILTGDIHFSFDKGGKGVLISTPSVSKKVATVHIKSILINNTTKARRVRVASIIYNALGKEVADASNTLFIKNGEKELQQKFTIANPALWSTDRPYLYRVKITITDLSTGSKLDELLQPLGLRWFTFDPGSGFFLNGMPLKLIGASRHQDFEGLGNALPDSLAKKDVLLLKQMGGNFLRVAHYPQDPAIMEACDELGILASVEIPVVNEITESDSFYNNCLQMQQEMIRQNFNHPSVILWCYMNEILLRPSFNNDKERQKLYFANIAKLAGKLDSLTRKEDPFRPTMMAHHGNYNLYKEVGLIDIPMIVGWNLYQGWYGANIKDLPVYLDRYHKDYPNKPMMITEYGADADPRVRTTEPKRFDKSLEYATFFHQYYYREIMDRPFIAGAMVWNLADFNSETRNETMPHINNKGLLRWNRTPKDAYYYYQAMLHKEPFIKILGDSSQPGESGSAGATAGQTIQVANNFREVQLFLNNEKPQKALTINGIAEFQVTLVNGNNTITAEGVQARKQSADHITIELRVQQPISQLNLLLGAKRSFIDKQGQWWMPAREYKNGSWGWIGGRSFKLPKGQLPYGTDKNIKGTFDDPIYQTQQAGINEFKIDAPDGDYEITMHFAELSGGTVEGLAYNLDSATRTEVTPNRIFSIIVNGTTLSDQFNIALQHGEAVAVSKRTIAQAAGGSGIKIVFKAIEGEPILNAIQIKKIKKD